MSDESRLDNPHALWQQQPREDTPVIVDHLVNRRTEQLHRSTRAEIVASMAAAIFFVAVLAWRLPAIGVALQPAGLAAAALWIAVTAFRFRRFLRGAVPAPDTASTGVAWYRRELEIRRDHLRNAWLWHGPLLLAALLCFASFAGQAFPGLDRFRNAAPLLVILLVWMAVGIRRRFRQAADIQREIDDIAQMEERP
jgi:hypothetical protein